MAKVSQIVIEGFRSIQSATVQLGSLNVFIGANGSGKSNFIGFIQLLNFALSRGLQTFVQQRGPGSALLHFGPKTTPILRGEVEFESGPNTRNRYRFTLTHAQGDTLIFTHEEAEYSAAGFPKPKVVPLGSGGHRESGLAEPWVDTDTTAKVLKVLLTKCRVYQFHDTSLESHLRGTPRLDDNAYLRANGGNLGAFLFRLKNEHSHEFRGIEKTINTVLPWFEDFVLEPQGMLIPLRWRMTGRTDYEFGASQLSDGSLRIMCLVTLLLQPVALRPQLMVLDEPELGLHPSAESLIAGLLKAASSSSQVLVATQSATFLDHFDADSVIVVENEDGQSTFKRQSSEALSNWLDRYSLGQIWQKDVIGGRP